MMITWVDLKNSLWLTAFLLIVSALVFSVLYGLAFIVYRRVPTTSRAKEAVFAALWSGMPLGFIGLVAGFLTGSSRSPAVSALVPAILAFTGLSITYLIGKSAIRGIIAGFAVFGFATQLLVGTVLGSASRDRHEEDLASVKVRELKADQEFKVRLYCKGLGLISDLSKSCPIGFSPNGDGEGANR
jgi:hypothetical protein